MIKFGTKMSRVLHSRLSRGYLPMDADEYLSNQHESNYKRSIKEVKLLPLPRCSEITRPRNGFRR